MKDKIILNKTTFKALALSLFIILSFYSFSSAATVNLNINTSTSSGSLFFFGGGGNVVTNPINCKLGQARNFRELIINLVIGCILSPLAYLIIGASVIVFLWGMVKFIKSEGDDRQGGRELMLWGVIGLFVMVSIWGLVNILSRTFGL